jgi:hypothetical protein
MKQHKWHKEIKAWSDGGDIELRFSDRQKHFDDWSPLIAECWDDDAFEFRIKPKSNWNKEKEAYDKGEKLEFKLSDEWHDWNYSFEPHWDIDEYEYRIKLEVEE